VGNARVHAPGAELRALAVADDVAGLLAALAHDPRPAEEQPTAAARVGAATAATTAATARLCVRARGRRERQRGRARGEHEAHHGVLPTTVAGALPKHIHCAGRDGANVATSTQTCAIPRVDG